MAKKHVYEYEVDLQSDLAPARVLRMVKPGSRVLEIGAGPGSITRHLSGTLNCDVVALEIDPAAIEKLRPFARSVFAADLNDAGWADLVRDREGQFDFVIAADVLEHVYDPWAVLGGMKSLLNDSGSVILSLPHVGHAAVAACLLDEDFEYRPWGLLDRTHIRFFGIKNIQALLRSQGLSIAEAEFVVRTPEMTEFAQRWRDLRPDVRTMLERNRFSHVYQVVSRAVPAGRADRDVDLLGLAVELPAAETVSKWERIMASVSHDPDHFGDQSASMEPRQSDPPQPGVSTLDEMTKADGVTSTTANETTTAPDVRLIAFYLPQFHPIPENDRWWGKGFTEWTNVTKAVPYYPGHYQPHLPADLGFYDLRVPEVRHQQVELAKAHGIHGFCYHYYWFSGHRLLERPLDDMLADPGHDMPFCLCWANENWTRRWDGKEQEVLIAQEYGPEDDLESIKALEKYIRDPRYIRVDGAPLVIIYCPQNLPDAARTLQVWREYCERVGIGPLHLACALTHRNWDHIQYGFESGVEFPPHNMKAKSWRKDIDAVDGFTGHCPDLTEIAEMYLANRYGPEQSVFRGVLPSWDNTARRGLNGTVLLNGSPENYEYWLSQAIRRTREEFPGEARPLFINAWNEWAEGCHLEPDRRHGHRFLDATLRALKGSDLQGWTHVGVPEEALLPPGKRAKAPLKTSKPVRKDSAFVQTQRKLVAWAERLKK